MTKYKNNKLEVTDKMVEVAIIAYHDCDSGDHDFDMRAALEAVFAMLPECPACGNVIREPR